MEPIVSVCRKRRDSHHRKQRVSVSPLKGCSNRHEMMSCLTVKQSSARTKSQCFRVRFQIYVSEYKRTTFNCQAGEGHTWRWKVHVLSSKWRQLSLKLKSLRSTVKGLWSSLNREGLRFAVKRLLSSARVSTFINVELCHSASTLYPESVLLILKLLSRFVEGIIYCSQLSTGFCRVVWLSMHAIFVHHYQVSQRLHACTPSACPRMFSTKNKKP